MSNVSRTTNGARLALTLQPAASLEVITGFDSFISPHDKRMSTPAVPYQGLPRVRDARLSNWGWFAESNWQISPQTRWVAGLRLDQSEARRYTTSLSDHRREQAMPSGFVRWEHSPAKQTTVYVGLGHVQRFPDYWELFSAGNSGIDKGNSFQALQTEKTTQLDFGAQWQGSHAKAWAAGYVGQMRDYILFNYAGNGKEVRNVDAHIAGFELGGSYRFSPAWTAQATLATVWQHNTTDDRPCHRRHRLNSSWVWTMPRARGRQAPCGDWLPHSTATAATKAMWWARSAAHGRLWHAGAERGLQTLQPCEAAGRG